MAEAARAAAEASSAGLAGRERYFEYRLVAPLFDDQGMIVSAADGEGAIATAVRDRFGRRTAQGTLR